MLLVLDLSSLARRLSDTWRHFLHPVKTSRRRNRADVIEALEPRELLTTFTVTTLADTTDPLDGVISLREAIQAANDTDAADSIEFLVGLNGSIYLTQEQLFITRPLTIQGNGPGNTIIDAQQMSRVFDIEDTAVDVTLDGLTITGGLQAAAGGGIYCNASGKLTLQNTVVTGNATNDEYSGGGGIEMSGFGDLVVVDSSITSNSTIGFGSSGGGINAFSNRVTITNSRIEGNSTSGHASRGGGLYTGRGPVTITSSSISSNSTAGDYGLGGGMYTGSGDLTLVDSTVSGNVMTGQDCSGAGIFTAVTYEANNVVIKPKILIQSSTISGNQTSSLDGYGGGGVYSMAGTLTIANSTVSGNSSYYLGAGVTVKEADLLAINCTIVQNVSTGLGVGYASGGVFSTGGSVTLYNSIVALNTAAFYNDIYLNFGVPLTVNNSLIGDNYGTQLSPAKVPDADGNLIGTNLVPIDPQIGPLAFNGGVTLTHALLASPCINLGNDAFAITAGLTFDQARQPRFDGSAVDMGAFEFQQPTVSFSTAASAVSESVGTYLVTVNLSAACALPVTIPFAVGGTATNPTDYTIAASPLVIPAGQLSGTIQLSVVNSAGAEPNETVILTMGNLINGVAGANTSTTVTIIDGATLPTVSFAAAVQSAAENAGTVTFLVNLNKAVGQSVQVPFTVAGTASKPGDYTISASPLIIPAGQTSGTITVTLTNDASVESNETVIVTLTAPVNATLGATTVDSLTITDDDFIPTVSFGAPSQNVNENSGGVSVTVNLSGPAAHDVTIPFGTTGTAAKPEDYIVAGSSPLVIPAGSTSGTITLHIVNDSEIEGAEQVTVTLGTPVNGILGAQSVQVVTITDDDFNTAPLIAGGQVFSIPENTGNGVMVGTVQASDSDNPAPFNTFTFSLSGNPGNAFVIDPVTGVISVTDSLYLDYEIHPQITVNVTVTDGGSPALSTAQDVTIDLTNVNEAPQIPASNILYVNENTTAVTTVTAVDPEQLVPTLIWEIYGGVDASKFAINTVTGELSFITAPDFEVPGDGDADNYYYVTVQATDNDPNPATGYQDFTVKVSNANEAPAITSGTSASIPENTTSVMTVTATDPEISSQTLSYSITGGPDAGKFNINQTTGALTFANPPNFEVPGDTDTNNVYLVTVKVSDTGGPSLSDTRNIQVTVTNANDAPTFVSSNAVSVPENTTSVLSVQANDADPGQTRTFSLSGGVDVSKFTIDPTTGALTFNAAPNFENPTDGNLDNVYLVAVKVTDNGAPPMFSTQNLQVTVNNVNEIPAFNSPNTLSILENTTFILTATSTDPDNGQTRTYSVAGGPDSGKFTINPTSGDLTFNSPPDFESPTDTGTDNVYNVTIKVTDNGSPNQFATQNVAVTILNKNDAPHIDSGNAVSVAEGTTAVATVTATDQDSGQTRTFSISGGMDAALFAIDPATGALSFLTAPDFELPTDVGSNNVYDLTVKVTDNGSPNLFNTQDVTVTVTNANEAPAITSSNAAGIPENTTVVMTVTATDPDAGQLQAFSIAGGADAALFMIDPATGVLAFLTAPDFEAPADANGDNVYNVTVQATDNGSPGLFGTRNVAVTVTDVADTPVISGGSGTVTFLKKHAPVALMPNVTISAPLGATSLGQVVVKYVIPKGGLLSDVTFTANGFGTVTESGPTSFKKSGDTHTVSISLNPGATLADVENFLHSFHFSSKKVDTAKHALGRKVEVQVFDRQGIASNKLVTQIQAKAK